MNPFSPDSLDKLIAPQERKKLLRLISRMVGQNFKLAVVEVNAPRERKAIIEWLRETLDDVVFWELDFATLKGENIWAEMRDALLQKSASERAVLVTWGFESLPRGDSAQERADDFRQLNVQRDLFVRDFPVPWLYFSHPSSRGILQHEAPDFCDFVALWIKAKSLPEVIFRKFRRSVVELPPEVARFVAHPMLREAWQKFHLGEISKANDALTRAKMSDDLAEDWWAVPLLEGYFCLEGGDTKAALDQAKTLAKKDLPLEPTILLNGFQAECEFILGNYAAVRQLLRDSLKALGKKPDSNLLSMVVDLQMKYRTLDNTFADISQLYKGMSEDQMPWITIANSLRECGEQEAALKLLQEKALPTYERLQDVKAMAETWSMIGDLFRFQGQTDEAMRVYREEVLPRAQQLGDSFHLARTWSVMGDIHLEREELTEALNLYQKTLPIFEKGNHIRAVATTLNRIGVVQRQLGDLSGALRIFNEIELPIYKDLGDIRLQAFTELNIADIYLTLGNIEKALQIYREVSLPTFEKLGDRHGQAEVWGKIADTHILRGQWKDALQICLEKELPVYESLGDLLAQAETQNKIAYIYFQQDPEKHQRSIVQRLVNTLEIVHKTGKPLNDPVEKNLLRFLKHFPDTKDLVPPEILEQLFNQDLETDNQTES